MKTKSTLLLLLFVYSFSFSQVVKDKKDEMWLGTDQDGLCKFNGKTFIKFEIK